MSRSKSVHDLSGLMKYAERAPWDEAMVEMLSAHLGPACEATGLEPDAIFEIIGDHWQGPLWGCSFEDLLTQELEPDGGNLIDDYLKRRGWNEKAPNKAYMHALRDTVMSLYEVSEVVPGQSMTLRDLLRDVAPVRVREHGATQTLVNWDKIAARIVDVNGRHGISGALSAVQRRWRRARNRRIFPTCGRCTGHCRIGSPRQGRALAGIRADVHEHVAARLSGQGHARQLAGYGQRRW
jgi:hypothetical protein